MHLPSLAAEIVFYIGSFPITNTLINAVIVSVGLIILAAYFRGRLKDVPSGAQNLVEAILETLFSYFDQVTGDRKKSIRFLPIVGTLFIFILISNLLGVFPGIGSVGRNIIA